MKRMLYFLSMLGLIFFLVACMSNKSNETVEEISEESEKNNLVLALGSEPEEGFDPTIGWGRYGSPLFQSTLIRLGRSFEVIYDLAEEVTTSDDGLEWTVTIRDDVLFSDGEPLTSGDVQFTFEKAKENKSIIDLQNVVSIDVLDEITITFNLSKPQSTFQYLLAMIGIVPKHAYATDYSENPIGSGPYVLRQWDKGQQIIVEKNPYYYGEQASFNQLTFLFLEENIALTAAKAGEVDIVALPAHLVSEEIPEMDLIQLKSVDNRGIMFPYIEEQVDEISGETIGSNITSDLAIRKAINIAINREQLINYVLDGKGTPAYSVADGLPWWNEETVFEDANVEKATYILKKAGWEKNEDGILAKEGLVAEFPLIYPSNDQVRQSLAVIVSEMVEEIGIKITPEGKSWAEISELTSTTPALMGWGSHDPLEMYNIYHSSLIGDGDYNANHYQNNLIDNYLDEAMHAITDDKANELWKKAQWDGNTGFATNGDAPWAWLVNLDHLYYVNEKLEIGEQKIQPHGHGWPITEFIEDWEWKE